MIHTDRLDRRGPYPKCLMRPHTRNIVNSLEFESAPEVSTGNSWKISNSRHIFSREIEHSLSYANAPAGKIVFVGPIFRRIVHALMQSCLPDEYRLHAISLWIVDQITSQISCVLSRRTLFTLIEFTLVARKSWRFVSVFCPWLGEQQKYFSVKGNEEMT